MHHKLTKYGRFCKQNNQLPTKTHVELKDNSNMKQLTKLHMSIYALLAWIDYSSEFII